jgi:hypothetical protein
MSSVGILLTSVAEGGFQGFFQQRVYRVPFNFREGFKLFR